MSSGSTSEVVLEPRVEEVAFGEAADQIAAAAEKPAHRSFDREIVAQLAGGDAAEEGGPFGRAVDAEQPQVVLLAREASIARNDERQIGPRPFGTVGAGNRAVVALAVHQHRTADAVAARLAIDANAGVERSARHR